MEKYEARHILTEKQVKEIREKYIPYIYTHKTLSNEYGISISGIKMITLGRNWKHL